MCFRKRSHRIASERKGVESCNSIKRLFRPRKAFHVADTEIALWNSLAGYLD